MRSLDRGKEIAVPRRRTRELRAPKRGEPSRWRRILRWFVPGRPADTVAVIAAATAVAFVLANALFLQPVPHPAPLFGEEPKPAPAPAKPIAARKSVPAAPAPIVNTTPVPLPRPEPAVAPRPRLELLLDIQRELTSRGYYDGTVDGLPGPRTSQAIRDFEQAQGLKQTGEPSDALLAQILKARSRKKDTTGSVAPEPRPSTRVLAVQRVLARLGYGPVKLTGLSDPATRAAIEQFERDRGLAKSGEINDRLVTELARVTGTSVE